MNTLELDTESKDEAGAYKMLPSTSYDTFTSKPTDRTYKFNREFILGSKSGNYGVRITPNAKIWTKLSISRPPQALKFNHDGEFLRQIILSDIPIGFSAKTEPVQVNNNNNGDVIYFKLIEYQCHYEQAGDIPSLYWLGINYLRIIDQNDNEIKMGECHKMKKETIANKIWHFTDLQKETGQLFLTAIYVSRVEIVALQFVDIVGNIDEKTLLSVYRLNSTQGLHEIANDENKILNRHIIGVEDDYPLQTLLSMIEFSRNWTSDPIVFYIAHFLKMIEKCIDGDLVMMHSVMALQRYIDHLIQIGYKHGYDEINDKKNMHHLIKIRQYWSALNKCVYVTKSVYFYTPSIDIYTLSYLDGTKWNYFVMITTFITQLGMLALLISSIQYENIDEELEKHTLSMIASIIICIIVMILVKRQIEGVMQFYKVIPESKSSLPLILSMIANIIISLLIIPLNFIIIAVTEDRFDLVLNALAILFILEVDDQIVDISPIDEKAVYFEKVQKMLMDQINAVDKQYITKFKSNDMLYALNIDQKNCCLDFNDEQKKDD